MNQDVQPTTAELLERIQTLEAKLREKPARRFRHRGKAILVAAALAVVPSLAFAASSSNPVFWAQGGNAGTNPAKDYLGTSDAQGLSIRTNGTQAIGIDANQNVTIAGKLNVQGGLQEDGAPPSNTYLKLDGSNAPSGGVPIDVTGNANTVTNGLYSNQFYADPSWLTSLSASKIVGTLPEASIPDLSSTYVTRSGDQTVSGVKTFTNTLATNDTDPSTSYFASSSDIGAWFRLVNTSPGGKEWDLVSTGDNNSEGPGKLLVHFNGDGPNALELNLENAKFSGTVQSLSGGFQFPDGTTQTTAQLPTFGGVVNPDGSTQQLSSGMTVTHNGPGNYTLTLPAGTVPPGDQPLIPMVNTIQSAGSFEAGTSLAVGGDGSETYTFQLVRDGAPADELFNFTFTRI